MATYGAFKTLFIIASQPSGNFRIAHLEESGGLEGNLMEQDLENMTAAK